MAATYSNFFSKLNKIKNREISLPENVEFFLDQINLKKNLNAFSFVFGEDALSNAKKIEDKILNNSHGKLAGLVVAIKDVLAVKDKPLTCSSNILKNFTSVYTATAVQKLIDEDAIIIGKTNCDEFAMGSSNENSAYGPVLNPVDATRVPGGSSGGSAAAVAGGLCDAALGTDTGGSIRQPAAFCGIVGLKPSYGRVSRFGLTAFASSFDSIGPFTNNITDTALIMEVLAGTDRKDNTSAPVPVPVYSDHLKANAPLTIGIPKEFFIGLNKEIFDAIYRTIDRLKEKNYRVVEIDLPNTQYTIAVYYILTMAEASSNLSRYDGIRYGERSADYKDIDELYRKTRSEGFGKEVKRRIMLGTYVLSSGYYDAYYNKAQKVRRLIKNDFSNAFKKVDVIFSPTTPYTAFKLGEKVANPLDMYLGDIYTTSANLAGIPAISIPVGKDKDGLPIGLQIMANSFNEEKLMQISNLILS
ncbi:MAG: Asp-tRNA(Asn)/Glu-tRNA(Gln) amidotransferase subunit GatA [Bacteroidota bacterium]|nr:Asp-tRNA(Asn)/Glu-tRNA(Gln) amidotransferase subunit GatA [Bacteroidota bacterium]